MKVLLYFEDINLLSKSGIGRAYDHQSRALQSAGIEYTTDPWDDYDLLHINTYSMNSSAVIKRARRLHKKVIYHAHSTEEDFRNSFIFSNAIAPVFRRYIVHLYKKADALITPTSYAVKLLKNYGLRQPVYAVSNGIDINRYRKDPVKITAYRRYFNLKPDDKVVLCAGMLFKRKGLEDFTAVAERMPDVQFIWFGDTPHAVIPRHNIHILHHHPDNVCFPGYIKGGIIEGAFSDADCFFFPSYEETEGIVVLEALAAGIPLVVRDIPVYDDWLKDEKDCYKGHDNDEFVHIIKGILNHTLPSTAAEGYKRAEERSIENIGIRLRDIYEEVLSH